MYLCTAWVIYHKPGGVLLWGSVYHDNSIPIAFQRCRFNTTGNACLLLSFILLLFFKYRTYLCGEWCIKVSKKGQILVLNIVQNAQETNVIDAFRISFNAYLWLPQNAPIRSDFILNVIICMSDISVHCFGFLECMSLVLCRHFL